MRKRGVFLFSIFLILLFYGVSAADYTVSRTVNTSQVSVDGSVEVSLFVDVGDAPNMADAYAIDDIYPSGWTVTDPGSGNTNQSQHIKWVVVGVSSSSSYSCSGLDSCVEPMQDVTYRYILQAPSSPETATIIGKYMFDVQSAEQNIAGTSITVIDNPPNECSAYDGDQTACSNAPEDCAWCPLNSNCEPTADIDCTASGCYNSTHRCTSNCVFSACGSNKFCNTSSDSCEDVSTNNNNSNNNNNNNNNNNVQTCTPNWEYGAWSDCVDGIRTRSKTDKNGCQSASTETSRCRTSSTSSTTSGSTTTPTRTRSSTSSSSPATTSERTRSHNTSENTRKTTPKTTEEVLDENAKTTDNLFYIILIILIVMGIIIFLYFKKRNILFNPSGHVNLSSQKKMIQGQQQQSQDQGPALNRWKPM